MCAITRAEINLHLQLNIWSMTITKVKFTRLSDENEKRVTYTFALII